MKKARVFTMVLCIAAAVIISLFINTAGGIALAINGYSACGIALIASTVLLASGTAAACFKKVWIPVVFNVIGTICYIYTVSEIYAIPNTLIPKQNTEPLAERHLLTVIVTVLLFALAVFNYFDDTNVDKRNKKRRLKAEKENRKLSDDEKII